MTIARKITLGLIAALAALFVLAAACGEAPEQAPATETTTTTETAAPTPSLEDYDATLEDFRALHAALGLTECATTDVDVDVHGALYMMEACAEVDVRLHMSEAAAVAAAEAYPAAAVYQEGPVTITALDEAAIEAVLATFEEGK